MFGDNRRTERRRKPFAQNTEVWLFQNIEKGFF